MVAATDLEVIPLHGTRADRQLAAPTTSTMYLVGLCNIDLNSKFTGRRAINPLAIDVQPGP
jgi:hypothetical protein